jgi:hypothetical protein
MRTLAKLTVVVCGLALTIYLTSYVSRLPESNCTTTEVSHLSSSDDAYSAVLRKKICNMGETYFYSVRVDKSPTPADRGWFLIQDIEQDPYPAQPPEPALSWNSHTLKIEILAKEFSGSIEYHPNPDRSSDDFAVLQSYTRAKP